MTVTEGAHGREARTSYRIIERLHCATLVQVVLHTGRTHQIRVHFQHLGFALVGDKLYGGRHNVRLKTQTNYAAGRQMLHAHSLSFKHPRTGGTNHHHSALAGGLPAGGARLAEEVNARRCGRLSPPLVAFPIDRRPSN